MSQPFHIAGAAAGPLLGRYATGVDLVRYIFSKTLGLIDSSQARHTLAAVNLASSLIPRLLDIFYRLRHYTRVFFTSAVNIKTTDELYLQVLDWLAQREARKRFITQYTAQTFTDMDVVPQLDSKTTIEHRQLEIDGLESPTHSYIKLTPVSNSTWFFYRWNLFAVLHNEKGRPTRATNALIKSGLFTPPVTEVYRESLTITCLGWSVAPIQALLRSCRDMAKETKKRTKVTIWGCADYQWEVMAVQPIRPLDTITIDENVKKTLVKDIKAYLNPQRRRFYTQNGIPYRRGYLLYGPPGCGKSTLSLALSGYFGLDIYMMNPANLSERELTSLFSALPTRCFVLLEDIDAIGFKRDGDDGGLPLQYRSSLSSLLNVLDGIASQEGRVVIMTANSPERLDKALVRPGRIDLKVHMAYITRQGAEDMFLRLMKMGKLVNAPSMLLGHKTPTREEDDNQDDAKDGVEDGVEGTIDDDEHETDEELQLLAQRFAQRIPERTLTPAQLQGFLLRYLHSATEALDKISGWVADPERGLDEQTDSSGSDPES
ncbi:P-loop containing nucleoside triphosphate hydrolase protein [Xylaria grammica]|nr:P-loop containing nucleoside triphosphate hydrolase protein [Xylaria grammica]